MGHVFATHGISCVRIYRGLQPHSENDDHVVFNATKQAQKRCKNTNNPNIFARVNPPQKSFYLFPELQNNPPNSWIFSGSCAFCTTLHNEIYLWNGGGILSKKIIFKKCRIHKSLSSYIKWRISRIKKQHNLGSFASKCISIFASGVVVVRNCSAFIKMGAGIPNSARDCSPGVFFLPSPNDPLPLLGLIHKGTDSFFEVSALLCQPFRRKHALPQFLKASTHGQVSHVTLVTKQELIRTFIHVFLKSFLSRGQGTHFGHPTEFMAYFMVWSYFPSFSDQQTANDRRSLSCFFLRHHKIGQIDSACFSSKISRDWYHNVASAKGFFHGWAFQKASFSYLKKTKKNSYFLLCFFWKISSRFLYLLTTI